MKKPKSKSEIRAEIDQEIANYIDQGGEVVRVKSGVSGLDERNAPLKTPIFNQPKTERTPIPDVIAALDERREKRSGGDRKANKPRRPRKKVIYDDFGEPLRTVWEED